MAEPLAKIINAPKNSSVRMMGNSQNFFLTLRKPHKSLTKSMLRLLAPQSRPWLDDYSCRVRPTHFVAKTKLWWHSSVGCVLRTISFRTQADLRENIEEVPKLHVLVAQAEARGYLVLALSA
jgi:hypothetical protein